MSAPSEPIDVLTAIVQVHRRVKTATDVSEMLVRSVEEVRVRMGLDACLALRVDGDRITTSATGVLQHAESERLRRRFADGLRPGSREAEAVRRPETALHPRVLELPSALGDAIGTGGCVVAPLAPEERAVALLVGLRDSPLTLDEQRLLVAYGMAIGAAMEIVVIRMRAAEMRAEMRRSSTTMLALAQEIADAPVSLPEDHGFGWTFPEAGQPVLADAEEWPLTTRERRVAELLVQGRANREIADALILSPETVKSHVSRILRKLGVSNRAEAVARLLGRPR
jgi:DNA-binding CsgD family transcriptional regulator